MSISCRAAHSSSARWSQVVQVAQLPGSTDGEIKNLWNSSLRKKRKKRGIGPGHTQSPSSKQKMPMTSPTSLPKAARTFPVLPRDWARTTSSVSPLGMPNSRTSTSILDTERCSALRRLSSLWWDVLIWIFFKKQNFIYFFNTKWNLWVHSGNFLRATTCVCHFWSTQF